MTFNPIRPGKFEVFISLGGSLTISTPPGTPIDSDIIDLLTERISVEYAKRKATKRNLDEAGARAMALFDFLVTAERVEWSASKGWHLVADCDHHFDPIKDIPEHLGGPLRRVCNKCGRLQ
jgi:hypothetical protein